MENERLHLPPGFWHFNIGHVAVLLLTLVSLFLTFGRLSERFDVYTKAQIALDNRVDTMDKAGTMASRNKLELEQSMLNDHALRVSKVEDSLSDLKVIRFKLDQVAEDVKTLKGRQ